MRGHCGEYNAILRHGFSVLLTRLFAPIADFNKMSSSQTAAIQRRPSQRLYAQPSGREVMIPEHEIMVSEVDLAGKITYCNDTFWRVTGFPRQLTLGTANHQTWHPDMPRAIFRLLSARLDAGKDAFAYVLGITAEGRHFWEFTQVVPTYGSDGKRRGLMIIRRAGNPGTLRIIIPLYQKLRAIELGAASKDTGISRAKMALDAILDELGQSYEDLIFSQAATD